MKYAAILLTMVNFIFIPHLMAACEVDKISAQISASRLNAQFEQSKKIAALAAPLKTKGRIWMSESNHLVWQVTYPIKSTLVINENGVTQYDRKDKKLPNKKGFSTTEISSLFLDIAKGDISSLQQTFETEWKCSDSSWRVSLTPKGDAMNNFLLNLSINGTNQIDGFSYQEQRGDITEIKLISQTVDLSEALDRYLD